MRDPIRCIAEFTCLFAEIRATATPVGLRLRVPRRCRAVVARRGPPGARRTGTAAGRARAGSATRWSWPRSTSTPTTRARASAGRWSRAVRGPPERTAVLSTHDRPTAARHLYRSIGFVDLLSGSSSPAATSATRSSGGGSRCPAGRARDAPKRGTGRTRLRRPRGGLRRCRAPGTPRGWRSTG